MTNPNQNRGPGAGRETDGLPGSSSARAFDPLRLWVLYDHPSDDRDAYVARLWEMQGGALAATHSTFRDHDLERLRALMRARGLFRLPRHPSDDPVIIETWL